ncbi:unnamed protein product (macronuclear) [Paramecium tetraurelia]|uniref:Uncharacterized protein n=1 Tax=Paramecium tetraurelia TaxID=5888 RepID=A0EAU9_PARTE|nr:uncharacterized protein GSPATT00025150001 [Paramecium tetraurelia]CAK92416.1 unnamed protein product [Paramecium tetraurelia]|eukprot:XP_001459813.1 hypothetical protein (macronuclear) [Paramecium tetraurelia strain d4-2]
MEKNKFQELWQTYICPERKLKRFKQAKDKKRYIKKAYPLEFGPDGKTLLQRGPWTQQEKEIYLQICQNHQKECLSNQTKELFQEILQLIPTRNLTQLKGYHNNHNPFQTIIIKESKRIRRTKFQMSQEKLKEFALKNKKKRQIKQLEKLSNLNNQIITQETQIIQFKLDDDKQIEIKVFINTDLLLNLNYTEDVKLEKDEIKTENLESGIQEGKEQLCQQKTQKDKIVVKLRNQQEIKVENVEDEPSLINKAKQIVFKELICFIELENKQNKRLFRELKQFQPREKHYRQLVNFKQPHKDDVPQIEQKQNNQKDEQQKKDKKVQQQITQPINTQNLQEVRLSPEKQQKAQIQTNRIKNSVDQKLIIVENQEQTNQNPNYIQIIDNNHNQFDQQQIKQSNSLIKSKKRSLSWQEIQVIEIPQDVQNGQEKPNKDEINQQFQENQEVDDQSENDNKKSRQKLQQLKQIQKQIKREKKVELEKQKSQELERQREIVLEKEIQIELEKERLRQIERDKQQEIQRYKKLEQQKEKEKSREKKKEKRLQFCNEHDRKERNRTKNRELKSLQQLSQQQNKTNNKEPKKAKPQNNQSQKSQGQIHHIKKQSGEQMAENQNQQQQELNLPSYIPHPYQIPMLDPIQQQQQYYMKQLQGSQFFAVKDCYQQLQFTEGQYQNQQELKNQNKDLSKPDNNPQFSQMIPIQIQNYPQQDQAIQQSQAQVPFQPHSPYIGNPYFYPQFMPVRQVQQQLQDGQQNSNKEQYQVEMMYVFQEVPQNFDPNCFFQFSPQSFVSIPGGSKLGDALK